jgi:hypothetical protein
LRLPIPLRLAIRGETAPGTAERTAISTPAVSRCVPGYGRALKHVTGSATVEVLRDEDDTRGEDGTIASAGTRAESLAQHFLHGIVMSRCGSLTLNLAQSARPN